MTTLYAPIPTLLAYLYPGQPEIHLSGSFHTLSKPTDPWFETWITLTPQGEVGVVKICGHYDGGHTGSYGRVEQIVPSEEVDWERVREVLTLLAIDQSTQEEEERERLSRLAEQKRILADKLSGLFG